MKQPSVLADLVTLTKPRIISLLLVTTVAPMFQNPSGMAQPPMWNIGNMLSATSSSRMPSWRCEVAACSQ